MTTLLDIDWNKVGNLFVFDPKNPLVFNTALFFVMFLGFMAVFFALKNRHTLRIIFCTAFSFYFYYKSGGFYFLLLMASTLIDYSAGNFIYRAKTISRKRLFLLMSVVFNLGVLGYFKYSAFFGDIFNSVFYPDWAPPMAWFEGGKGIVEAAGMNPQLFTLGEMIVPAGISFFTFQAMSYTIDIYRGHIQPVKTVFDFSFFVSFFPHFVAGPIIRASDLIPQIRKTPYVSSEELGKGLWLICGGLFKKVVLADFIASYFADEVFRNPAAFSGVHCLIAVYAYAIRIYADFSGYSDMAIGIARLLGFWLPANFNAPYISTSVTEFWRRWHISLSTWLRDYLYIPLGGNRKGLSRQYFNLFITMLLGGLWHGANWRFIFWGCAHGIALAFEKLLFSIWPPGKSPLRKVFGWFLTFHFVCFCWIFFTSRTFEDAWTMVSQIATAFHPEIAWEVISAYWLVIGLLVLGYLLHFTPVKWENALLARFTRANLVIKAVIISLVIILCIQFMGDTVKPFIYFSF